MKWSRILIHDGDEDWVKRAQDNSYMPPGITVRKYAGPNTLWQFEGKVLEALAEPLIHLAQDNRALTMRSSTLKEVEQVLAEYDGSSLHPADKIRKMLQELPLTPQCKCGANLNLDDMDCICFHGTEGRNDSHND